MPRDSVSSQVADNLPKCGHNGESCGGEQGGADAEAQHPTLWSQAASWVSFHFSTVIYCPIINLKAKMFLSKALMAVTWWSIASLSSLSPFSHLTGDHSHTLTPPRSLIKQASVAAPSKKLETSEVLNIWRKKSQRGGKGTWKINEEDKQGRNQVFV